MINMKSWRRESPGSAMARIAPFVVATTVLAGIGLTVLLAAYYVGSNRNFLTNNDPIGKEAGFERVVEQANDALKKVGATWFATTDYRIYSMLRWHLRDRVPVVQINERSRYIGFRTREPDVSGPTGLYVAQKDEAQSKIWTTTTAVLQPVGMADLSWRGFRYETYRMEKLTNWKPVLSPLPDDPLFASSPH